MTGKEPEYTLNVFRRVDKHTRKKVVVFLVQTTKIFVSFRYQILLEDEVKDRTIHLRIVGLHAPSLLMPGMGPARGHREYDTLAGSYNVVVTKQDNTVNEVSVHITDKAVSCSTKGPAPFILVSNEPVSLN